MGIATLGLGAMLAIVPRAGRVVGLGDPRAVRLIGLADLALVPGLVRGRKRSGWVASRAGLNVAIAAYALRAGADHRAKALAAGLFAVTSGDLTILRSLSKPD